jgi:hypothetical protein
MDQYFLLTYSVKAVTSQDGDIEKASYVRDDIGALKCWVKVDHVETTFAGMAEISGMSDEAKKKCAIKEVEKQFVPVLKQHDATHWNVRIYCAMMVGSIKVPFEFFVEI